jgi:hypothetical protein
MTQHRNNVIDAAIRDLPRCRWCNAERGDPCRMPGGETRHPHSVREDDLRNLQDGGARP